MHRIRLVIHSYHRLSTVYKLYYMNTEGQLLLPVTALAYELPVTALAYELCSFHGKLYVTSWMYSKQSTK
jgi:hypothetical protein